MRINDIVYGSQDVTDPAMVALIQSPPFQRLKHVGQGGLLHEHKDPQRTVRYCHCIGVALLLQKLGASREEQVAGLLHDVSHTAFSHTVDVVLGDPLHSDFQDRNHDRYIAKTVIPQILREHRLPPECAEHPTKERFPLLEQDIPLLCADRVDYTLRNAAHRGKPAFVKECIAALTTRQSRIVFSARETAVRFWQVYDELQESVWASPDEVAKTNTLGQAMKLAYDAGALTLDDLYQDDHHVERILRSQPDPRIKRCLSLLDNGFTIVPERAHPDTSLQNKFRYVDPEFIEDGRLRKVSEIVPGYHDWLAQRRSQEKYTKNGMGVRIVPNQT